MAIDSRLPLSTPVYEFTRETSCRAMIATLSFPLSPSFATNRPQVLIADVALAFRVPVLPNLRPISRRDGSSRFSLSNQVITRLSSAPSAVTWLNSSSTRPQLVQARQAAGLPRLPVRAWLCHVERTSSLIQTVRLPRPTRALLY